MKIVLIENNFVHWDASHEVPDLDWAKSHYAPDFIFVEAPDFVREGWIFDETLEGDDRFIPPEAPEGWVYDYETGSFFEEGSVPSRETSTIEDAIKGALDNL